LETILALNIENTTDVDLGSGRGMGQMYSFLKYKMGNMDGLMNPKNPKIL
jgi:hypothetical protein